MTHAPGIPETVCPYSGVVAADNDFTHPDDMAAGLKVVEHAFHADTTDAIHGMLDDLSRSFRGAPHPTKMGTRALPDQVESESALVLYLSHFLTESRCPPFRKML
jgi:hypothetical protein